MILIVLTISMSFVTAESVNIYLNSQYPNKVSTNSNFNIEVSDANDQVYAVLASGEVPFNCNADFSSCSRLASVDDAGQKTFEYKIGSSDIKTHNYLADSSAPIVEVSQVGLNGNELTVSFSVKETLTGTYDGSCTGIESVVIYADNKLLHAMSELEISELLETSQDQSNCQFTTTKTFELVDPIAEFNINIYAKDVVGNADSTLSDTALVMDTQIPVIRSTFDLKQGDVLLNSVSLNPTQSPVVDVIVYITDNNIVDKNSVVADLSSLNNIPAQSFQYKNSVASFLSEPDSDSGEQYAVFKDIALHVGEVPVKINVTVVDAQLNEVTQEISRDFQVVSATNEVVHLGPSLETNCDSNKNCFMRSNGLMQVVIDGGDDSTFNQLHVPLKTHQFSDFEIVHPFSCNNDNGPWICNYLIVASEDLSDGAKKVYIDYSATDDSGRALTGIESANIVFDNTAPEIIGDFNILVNGVETLDTCLTSSDTLTFNAQVKDSQSSQLKIQLATNATSQTLHEADCELIDGVFNCNLDITNFFSTNQEEKILPVSFRDLAGNIVKKDVTVNLCEADLETSPQYVKELKVPNELIVDKKVANNMYWKSFIPVEFDLGSSTNVHLLDYEIHQCTLYYEDAGADYIYPAEDSYYFLDFNKGSESAKAIVKIGGQNIDVPNDTSLDLICETHIKMRHKGTYFMRPQKINFTIPVSFEGFNVVGPDETIQDKINVLKDEIKSNEAEIETRENLNNVLGSICAAAKSVATINSVIQTVDLVLRMVEAVFGPFAEFYHKFAASFQSTTTRYFWPPGNSIANMFGMTKIIVKGKPISSWRAAPIGTGIKSVCFIYECKFYDASEIVDFGFNALEWDEKVKKYSNKESGGSSPGAITRPQDKVKDMIQVKEAQINNLDNQIDFAIEMKELGQPIKLNYLESLKKKSELASEVKSLKSNLGLEYARRDSTMQQHLDFSTWVVNPYKSYHYDDLCAPATLYNMKKERELKCLKINCLESVKASGLDSRICDEQYNVRDCLYLESAYGKANEGKFPWATFAQAAASAIFGNVMSYAYQGACGEFYAIDSEFTPYEGQPVRRTLCAGLVVYLAYSEIEDAVESGFGYSYFDQLDSNLGNACEGINFD
jgi:hypothetical protein